MKKMNQVQAGAFVSYITIFFNIVSGFIYTPWLITRLGQSDYALFSLVTSVMVYFVLDFGMGAAITRFIARYRATNDEDKIKNLLGVTTKIYLLLDTIILFILIIFYFLIDNIYVSLSPEELARFKVVFVISSTMSVFSFPLLPTNGIYTAYGKLYAQKLFDLLSKVVTVLAVVIGLIFGGDLYIVVLLNTLINLIFYIIKLIYIFASEGLSINIKCRDKTIVKSIFGFSVWVMLTAIADRFFFTFIPSLLGMVSTSAEIAIFAVAVSVENYICLFASAFNNLFLPKVTEMVINKASGEMFTDLMIKVGRIQLIIVSTIVVGLVSQGLDFIQLWVGTEYKNAYYVLVLIIIPSLVHFSQAIANEMIYATNNVKYKAIVYSVGSVISVVVTLLLGPRYGAVGAGVGIGVALVLSHIILMNYFYYKKLHLNIWRYFKECHFIMYIPLLASVIIGGVFSKYWPVENLIQFCSRAAIWLFIHLLIMWAMILKQDEKQMIVKFISKKNK